LPRSERKVKVRRGYTEKQREKETRETGSKHVDEEMETRRGRKVAKGKVGDNGEEEKH
jgi:hypothetical protein